MPEKKPKKILINGKWRETAKVLTVTNPFDGGVVDATFLAGGAELKEAVDAAQAAFKTVKAMPAYKKAEILQKVVDALKRREEEFAKTITLEAGKPIKDSRVEVRRAQNTFQIALEETKRMDGTVMPLDIFPGSEGRFGIIKRFPLGVVLGIAPFNFPLNLVAHKAAPAMASGNTALIKPASKTPLTALLLGEVITEAGWPDGGVNIVPCCATDAETLLEDPRIKKLTFTGSAAVGWRLKEKAGGRRVTLELGGNAGVIIHNDVNIEAAATRCAAGAFSCAGQICISVQRIYVERPIFERFKEAYLSNVKALKIGDPLGETTDVGPMIEESAAIKTETWVKEAVKEGATILAGGKRDGAFMSPTVLTGTKPSMKVCREEAFAPIVTLEPYDKFEDAVNEVNGSTYGLQAGVFTKDASRIFYAYENLEAGGVIINDIPTFRTDNMPYGGVKQSGFGREGVKYAMEEMTEVRLLAMKV
ncbi:MAG: aldehyde dehydrogenase family protein [Deltaproteobacteria bacterium]|nr:aldehyde dehydrogenase family protein [Deltaproteobacteria bacterium]